MSNINTNFLPNNPFGRPARDQDEVRHEVKTTPECQDSFDKKPLSTILAAGSKTNHRSVLAEFLQPDLHPKSERAAMATALDLDIKQIIENSPELQPWLAAQTNVQQPPPWDRTKLGPVLQLVLLADKWGTTDSAETVMIHWQQATSSLKDKAQQQEIAQEVLHTLTSLEQTSLGWGCPKDQLYGALIAAHPDAAMFRRWCAVRPAHPAATLQAAMTTTLWRRDSNRLAALLQAWRDASPAGQSTQYPSWGDCFYAISLRLPAAGSHIKELTSWLATQPCFQRGDVDVSMLRKIGAKNYFILAIGVQQLAAAVADNNRSYLNSWLAESPAATKEELLCNTVAVAAYLGCIQVLDPLMTLASTQDVSITKMFNFNVHQFYVFRCAAKKGHLEILDKLFELAQANDVSVNQIFRVEGLELFHLAVGNGHLAILNRLVELAQANDVPVVVEMLRAWDFYAFRSAAPYGHLAILNKLVELAQADQVPVAEMLRAQDFYAFCSAVNNGHLAVLNRLVELAQAHHVSVAEMLRARDFYAFNRGAAYHGHLAILNRLIELAQAHHVSVAEMIRSNDFGALTWAVYNRHLAMQDKLVELAQANHVSIPATIVIGLYWKSWSNWLTGS